MVQRAVQGTSKALSFAPPQHGGPSTASGRPAPGALSLTPGTARFLKHQLQWEAHCSQSQGKEDPLLKSLCHLTRRPKSSPRAHLRLQSIPAGRRAGHSCHLSIPHCCRATRGPSPAGLGGPKEPLERVQIPHKPRALAQQGAAGARLTSAASHRAGEGPKGSCDSHRDSQHNPAMMSHGGRLPGPLSSPAREGQQHRGHARWMQPTSLLDCLCNAWLQQLWPGSSAGNAPVRSALGRALHFPERDRGCWWGNLRQRCWCQW